MAAVTGGAVPRPQAHRQAVQPLPGARWPPSRRGRHPTRRAGRGRRPQRRHGRGGGVRARTLRDVVRRLAAGSDPCSGDGGLRHSLRLRTGAVGDRAHRHQRGRAPAGRPRAAGRAPPGGLCRWRRGRRPVRRRPGFSAGPRLSGSGGSAPTGRASASRAAKPQSSSTPASAQTFGLRLHERDDEPAPVALGGSDEAGARRGGVAVLDAEAPRRRRAACSCVDSNLGWPGPRTRCCGAVLTQRRCRASRAPTAPP
jgi:hypothetical protein